MTALAILSQTKPCIKCGASDRFKSGDCKSCAKITNAAYRLLNQEKVKATNAAWAAANADRKSFTRDAWTIANQDRVKAAKSAWYQANKERMRESSIARDKANPEIKKASRAAWDKANPERKKSNNAAWDKANPERKKANATAWATANAEQSKATKAAWQQANPDRVKKNAAAWSAKNPDARRIYGNNRNAKKRESCGKLSKGLAVKLFNLQQGMCPCCSQPLGDDYHLDHIMPLSNGGPNVDSNIQLLRALCNVKKSAQHPVDFMQSRGFLL